MRSQTAEDGKTPPGTSETCRVAVWQSHSRGRLVVANEVYDLQTITFQALF
jgi:hypothetical protein